MDRNALANNRNFTTHWLVSVDMHHAFANSSSYGLIVTTAEMAADFLLCAMPFANSSILGIVGAVATAVEFCAVPNANSLFKRKTIMAYKPSTNVGFTLNQEDQSYIAFVFLANTLGCVATGLRIIL